MPTLPTVHPIGGFCAALRTWGKGRLSFWSVWSGTESNKYRRVDRGYRLPSVTTSKLTSAVKQLLASLWMIHVIVAWPFPNGGRLNSSCSIRGPTTRYLRNIYSAGGSILLAGRYAGTENPELRGACCIGGFPGTLPKPSTRRPVHTRDSRCSPTH